MANLFQPTLYRATDITGNPSNNSKIYFYVTGTNDAATWYTDAEETSPGVNPLVSNSVGVFVPAYLSSEITYRIKHVSADELTTYWDIDPVQGYDNNQLSAAAARVEAGLYYRSQFSVSPQSENIDPAVTTGATLRTAVNTLIDDNSPGRMIAFPAVGSNYSINAPIIIPSGTTILLEGDVVTTASTGNISVLGQAIATGLYSPGYTSPGWTASTPTALYTGAFNAAGEFVLEATGTNIADALAAFDVGTEILFLSDAAYEFPIGSGGSGGTGLHREEVLPLTVTGLGADRITVDRVPMRHTAGSLSLAVDPTVVETGVTSEHHMRILRDVNIVGTGSLTDADNAGWTKSGLFRAGLDIDYYHGRYGMGGNSHHDGRYRVKYAVGVLKAWDVAAQSFGSSFNFHTMDVLGTGVSPISTVGSINEHSSFISISGHVLRFPNNTDDSALQFLTCRNCDVSIKLVDARKVSNSVPMIQIGTNAGTNVDGGLRWCKDNKVSVDYLQGGTPKAFVEFADGDNTNNPNHDNSAYIGRAVGVPGTAAVIVGDDVYRAKVEGYFENGDVTLGACFNTYLDVRLDKGSVLGQNETNADYVRVDGKRVYPGAVYSAIITTVGAVTPTPDCRAGQVSENSFETRYIYSAATGATVGAPTGTPEDGQLLTVNIKNTSGSAMTLAFNAVYTGTPSFANITAGSRTVATFRYSGSWSLVGLTENTTEYGPKVINETFDAEGKWVLSDNCSIASGSLANNVTGVANGNYITSNRIRSGASYRVTTVVTARAAGSVTPSLGGTAGSAISAAGTSTQIIVAGSDYKLNMNFTSLADTGFLVGSVTVEEL